MFPCFRDGNTGNVSNCFLRGNTETPPAKHTKKIKTTMEKEDKNTDFDFFTKEIAARIDAKKLCGMECVMMRRKDEITFSEGEQAIAIAIMLKGGMSVDGVSCLLNIAPAKVALASLILRAMGVIY